MIRNHEVAIRYSEVVVNGICVLRNRDSFVIRYSGVRYNGVQLHIRATINLYFIKTFGRIDGKRRGPFVCCSVNTQLHLLRKTEISAESSSLNKKK